MKKPLTLLLIICSLQGFGQTSDDTKNYHPFLRVVDRNTVFGTALTSGEHIMCLSDLTRWVVKYPIHSARADIYTILATETINTSLAADRIRPYISNPDASTGTMTMEDWNKLQGLTVNQPIKYLQSLTQRVITDTVYCDAIVFMTTKGTIIDGSYFIDAVEVSETVARHSVTSGFHILILFVIIVAYITWLIIFTKKRKQ